MTVQRRCNIFSSHEPSEGKVVLLPSITSLEQFLHLASDKLGLNAQRLFFANGAEIDDVSLIRDNDTIYVSEGEEYLKKPIVTKKSRNVMVPIAVMGPGSVGKSAISLQFVQGVFMEDYDPTIEDAYRKNIIDHYTNEPVMLDILDTAGQENYVALRSTWMRERNGFLLVFSLADRSTFDDLRSFHDQLCEMHEHVPPLIVIGNKADMENQRQVSFAEGQQLAEEFGAAGYIETSAKTSMNVDQAFRMIVYEIRRLQLAKEPLTPMRKRWARCSIL